MIYGTAIYTDGASCRVTDDNLGSFLTAVLIGMNGPALQDLQLTKDGKKVPALKQIVKRIRK